MSAGEVACAKLSSSSASEGSACVIPMRCHVPSAPRMKQWSLMYHFPFSPTDGS